MIFIPLLIFFFGPYLKGAVNINDGINNNNNDDINNNNECKSIPILNANNREIIFNCDSNSLDAIIEVYSKELYDLLHEYNDNLIWKGKMAMYLARIYNEFKKKKLCTIDISEHRGNRIFYLNMSVDFVDILGNSSITLGSRNK